MEFVDEGSDWWRGPNHVLDQADFFSTVHVSYSNLLGIGSNIVNGNGVHYVVCVCACGNYMVLKYIIKASGTMEDRRKHGGVAHGRR